jgi:hypothetical protein
MPTPHLAYSQAPPAPRSVLPSAATRPTSLAVRAGVPWSCIKLPTRTIAGAQRSKAPAPRKASAGHLHKLLCPYMSAKRQCSIASAMVRLGCTTSSTILCSSGVSLASSSLSASESGSCGVGRNGGPTTARDAASLDSSGSCHLLGDGRARSSLKGRVSFHSTRSTETIVRMEYV